MPTQAENVADLVEVTLGELDKGMATNLLSDYQHHFFLGVALNTQNTVVREGRRLEFRALMTPSASAASVGLFNQDNVSINDGMVSGYVPWRHHKCDFGYDDREFAMCSGEAELYDLLTMRRAQALSGMADYMERQFWGAVPSSTDTLSMLPVNYWIVYNATTGFTGGAPSGHTTVGNINPTTYPKFKNWSANYTDANKADLITSVREGVAKTNFIPFGKIPEKKRNAGGTRWYTNWTTVAALETLGESQNENLGRDVAPFYGDSGKVAGGGAQGSTIQLRGCPVYYVPYLDDNVVNTDPLIGINWDWLNVATLKGYNMQRTGPMRSPTQHNCMAVFYDLSCNTICRNRRAQMIFAKA